MPHIVEAAKTGRAKCRGCGQPIAAGVLRFGERVPNPFADDGGETTHWFHVSCAAFMRPEAFLETLPAMPDGIDSRDELEREARLGVAHRRLPRATTAERAATGRAACRACKQPIEKGAWRIALKYYDEGRFAPSGFIHVGCAPAYLETTDVIGRLRHFSPGLSEEDVAEIRQQLAAASA
jgi:hypothetical protein